MTKTLKVKEIAKLLDGEILGDEYLEIVGVAGIREARQGEITFIANPKYKFDAKTTKASAIIVGEESQIEGKTLIKVNNPYLAFLKVLEFFGSSDRKRAPGLHLSAILGKNVNLGSDVLIQANVYIGNEVQIGDKSVIYPNVYIGDGSKIGSEVLIYPNVTIRERTSVGNRVIIHSGAVIGSDGFGFVKHDGKLHKIPHLGTVVIEDDVEIGANVTIDRATLNGSFTLIKSGTKIDNLVQIGHNVVLEEDCLVVAQVGIGGSAYIERGATLAGQAGVAGHVRVGANTVVAGKSGVTKNIPKSSAVSGFPAIPHSEELKIQASTRLLPLNLKKLRRMEKQIAELEVKIENLLEGGKRKK